MRSRADKNIVQNKHILSALLTGSLMTNINIDSVIKTILSKSDSVVISLCV